MKSKAILSMLVVAFNAPLLVVACSSSSSSGGGAGAVSSIDASKQGSSLSDAERVQYCKDVAAYGAKQIPEADAKKAACFGSAVTTLFVGGAPKDDAELRSKCKTAYQDCLSKPLAKGDAGTSGEPDCSSAVKDLGSCNATIGELNTCFADQVNGAKAAYTKFDTACDSLQSDGGGFQQSSPQTPASCKSLEAKCPAAAKVDG